MSKDTNGHKAAPTTVLSKRFLRAEQTGQSTRSPNTRRKNLAPRTRARPKRSVLRVRPKYDPAPFPRECRRQAPPRSAIGALGIGLATTATVISVINPGPTNTCAFPNKHIKERRRSITRVPYDTERRDCHKTEQRRPKDRSAARMPARQRTPLASLPSLDVGLARYGSQFSVFDSCIDATTGVDGANFNTASRLRVG